MLKIKKYYKFLLIYVGQGIHFCFVLNKQEQTAKKEDIKYPKITTKRIQNVLAA